MKHVHISYGFYIVTTLLYLGSLTACKETEEVLRLDGRLIGQVFLYDAAGGSIDTHEEVQILMDNGRDVFQSISNEEGKFEFTALMTGTYDISFSKEGFNTYWKYGYAFIGGEKTVALGQSIELVAQSSIFLGNLEMEVNQIDDVTFFSASADLLFNPENLSYTGVRYFLSNNSAVSKDSYLQTGATGVGLASGNILFNFPIEHEALLAARKVYLIIYSCTSCDLYYKDIASGNNIYYTTNSRGSSVAEATMP